MIDYLKMKIAIVEPTPLDIALLGGSGVVFMNIVKVLKDRDYTIELYTPLRPIKFYGAISNYISKVNSYPLSGFYSSLLARLLTRSPLFILGTARLHLISSYFKSFNGYDYSICTTYDGLFGHFDLGYVHYPARKFFKAKDINKIKNFVNLLDFITSFGFKDKTKRVLTNSTYTAKLLHEKSARLAEVLYPPVKPIDCEGVEEKKENIVVSLGRIVEDKKYEDVIYAASFLRDVKFFIIGRVQDEHYYTELRRKSPPNVTFVTNASEEEKREILCKSKVILHAKREEPFGIAVAEGMTAGNVPVVYKNGGTWLDIVSEGKFGYGYERAEELPELIRMALNDDTLRKEVREKALMFNEDNFRENFLKITGL